jgi:EmrB/QacA subfamily drug resistance transporter
MTRRRPDQKTAVTVVFVLAVFMVIMDTSIVNVALPVIGRDLGAGPAAVGAVSIGYLVSLAVTVPASGWAGDRFGGRRVLLGATAAFTVASVLCAAAGSFLELVAFRVLQGAAGGMMTPVAMAMTYRTFPAAERARASAIVTVTATLAPATGPLLGGLLAQSLSWRWVFLVNLPVGLAALAYGTVFLRDAPAPGTGRFDLPGFLLSGAGLAAVTYAISAAPDLGWDNPVVVAALAVGAVLIAALIGTQLRVPEPLVNLRLLGDRLFRSMTATMALTMAAFLGLLFLAALFLQDGLGLSPLSSGLRTFPEAIGVMVGSPLAARVTSPRAGPRRTTAGALIAVAALTASLTLVNGRSGLWALSGALFLIGIAIAHVFVTAQACAFARITPRETGRATALFTSLRQLGSAVGIAAVTTALVTASGQPPHPVALHGYHMAFAAAAVIALLAAAAAATVHDNDTTHPPANPPLRAPQTSHESPGPATTPAYSSPESRFLRRFLTRVPVFTSLRGYRPG